jgi:hypothetical protein
VSRLVRHRSTEDHEAPSRVGIRTLLPFIVSRSGRRANASHVVVAAKVALDEVTLFECVLDWIAMVVVWHLDYLV